MYWCIFKMNQYIYNSEHLGLKVLVHPDAAISQSVCVTIIK